MPRPRVVFLGTGGALNPERYQASILVQAAGTTFLLDVGGGLGVVRRLLACEVDPLGVRHVVLSHRHLDHVGGLEPLLMYMFYAAHRTEAPPPPVSAPARAGVRALAMFHTPAPVWVAPGDLLAEARHHAPGVEVFLSEDGMVWPV